MTEQLSPLALQALAVVKESGAIIGANHAHPHTIRHKGRIDLVTETDIAVEAFLKERLATLAPQAGFLAEERGRSEPAGYLLDHRSRGRHNQFCPRPAPDRHVRGLPPERGNCARHRQRAAAPRMLYCGKGERGMAQRGTHQRLIRDGLRECPCSHRFSL